MRLDRRILPGLVALLALLLAIGPARPVSARVFPSCDAVLQVFPRGVARSTAAQVAAAERLGVSRTAIPVKPAIYRKNVNLDSDRDGVICEEKEDLFAGAATVMEIFRCVLGSSKNSYACCSAMRDDYPYGIARDVGSRGFGSAVVDAGLYWSHSRLDWNRNGVACDSGDPSF